MQRIIIVLAGLLFFNCVQGQTLYDSVTVSGCRIEEQWYGAKWKDTLRMGGFPNYIFNERTAWKKGSGRAKASPDILALANSIKANGTADIAKCFIPRHSVNFYKQGKIVRYLLVCFECEGVRFSDDPPVLFIKKEGARLKQLKELEKLFSYML